MKITAPKDFFGFDAGTKRGMARWDKIVEYFYLLQTQSDRVKVINMGNSTEGNPFLQVIIFSKENLENLNKIKRDNTLITDPRGLSEERMTELAKEYPTEIQSGADRLNYDRFCVPARYAKAVVRKHGHFMDEALFADKPLITTARTGDGEIVLYGFQPHLRMQTDGTFKLLMNALYQYENPTLS